MSPRVRLALSVLFITGFFVSAPLVILYTAGFRYDVQTGRISQTGLLSLGSIPRGATIYLDGEKLDQKTPAVLKNVLPGDHRIRFEREGYSSWEKTLVVESRQTTFATDVALFLTREPEHVITGDIVADAIQPGTGFSAFALSSGEWIEVWAITQNDTQTLIARLPASEDLTLAWSDTENEVRITTASGTQRVRIGSGAVTSIPEEMEDIPTDASGLLSAVPSLDRTAITRREADGTSKIIAYLPLGNYVFRGAPPGLAMLEDPDRRHIVVLDLADTVQPILLNAEARRWQWKHDEKQILYSDGFDLHIYDAVRHTDETVTRVSDELTGIAWYPPAAAVLYSQAGGVYAIELDYRDSRNVITLATGENIHTIGTDAEGDTVLFFGVVDGQEGLWKREL